MSKNCFDKLCKKIELAVGGEEFKSEHYINTKLKIDHDNLSSARKKRRMFYAHFVGSGG